MTIIDRKTTLTITAAILIIALALPWICFTAKVQATTNFDAADKFDIPSNNSTISFNAGGTYTQASLENATWNFVGLSLNYSQPPESLRVSAQNSDIMITSCQTFNTTFAGAILRYFVEGQGKQT